MIPLRLVIDTNIIVSAALKPDGLQRTVLLLAITRPARLYVTETILAEYREVLARPKLHIPKGRRQQLLYPTNFGVPTSSGGTSFNDSPAVTLQPHGANAAIGEKSLAESFTTYLMWDPLQPSGCKAAGLQGGDCSSIPVPLGTLTWGFSCAALNTLVMPQGGNGTTWLNGCGITHPSGSVTFAPGNAYPTWQNILATGQRYSDICQ